MTSFSLSWYCLLQQLPYHNSSRADFPRQPLAQAPGDKPAHQLPLFTKQKYHSDSESSFRFESIHVPPTKRAHWGSHPPNEHRMSHSLSSFRPELGRGDRSSCNAGSEVLPRGPAGKAGCPWTPLRSSYKSISSLPPHWCGRHALTLCDAQGARGLHGGTP